MEENKEHRAGRRARWIVQGLAIAALGVGPGMASASVFLTPHVGSVDRPGDITTDTQIQTDQPCVDCPEPGTLALMFAGFAGLIFVQTRRRSAKERASGDAR